MLPSRCPPPAAACRRHLTAYGVLFAVVAFTAWQRARGLDPDSLFIDDQWLAVACTQLSAADLHALHTPAPIGFAVLSGCCALVFGDPEWSLQVMPFVCGLVQIPLFFWLVLRLTKNPWIALFGALLAAGNPLTAEYSVRVKQYVPGQLWTTLLLALAIPVYRDAGQRDTGQRDASQRDAGSRSTWVLVGVALIAAGFSFGAILVGLCLVNVLALRRSSSRSRWAAVIVYDLAVVSLYLVDLRFNRSPGLQAFWQEHFLSLDSGASVQRFLELAFVVFPVQAFSQPLCWLTILVPVGLWVMLRSPDPVHRYTAMAGVILFGGMIFAAAVHLLPIGVGRTEIFSYPLLWLPVCCAVAHWRPGVAVWRPRAWTSAGWMAAVALVVVGLVVPPQADYPRVLDRQGVARCARVLQDSDGLLLTSHAALTASYYGPWQVRIERHTGAGHNFVAVPQRPSIFVLPMAFVDGSATDRPARLDPFLAAPLTGDFERLVYLSTHGYRSVDAHVHRQALAHGYRLDSNQTLSGRVAVRVYVSSPTQAVRAARAAPR